MHERVAAVVALSEQPTDPGGLDGAGLPHGDVAGVEFAAGQPGQQRACRIRQLREPGPPVMVDLFGDEFSGA